jgi:thiol:disulfide interchange protein DsbA
MMRRLLSLLSALAIFAAGCSNAAEPFAEGVNYYKVASPQLMSEPTPGKVEVIEAFNYACIHCFHFQPLLETWLKTPAAQKAKLVYLPAAFNPSFAVFARGYFAAEELGVAEKTHDGVYDQMWNQHATVQTLDGLADVYEHLGVNKAEFLKVANSSFNVDAKLRQSLQLLQRYQIDGTPSVIVAGKYRITGDSAGSMEKVFDVVNYLIDRELGQKRK